MSSIGHNTLAGDRLKSIVSRIEKLEEQKSEIADDIRDVYAEAKGNGYDVKALREIVRRRKKDAADMAEHEAIVETYMMALGMLAGTPLGDSAVERAGLGARSQMDLSERKDIADDMTIPPMLRRS